MIQKPFIFSFPLDRLMGILPSKATKTKAFFLPEGVMALLSNTLVSHPIANLTSSFSRKISLLSKQSLCRHRTEFKEKTRELFSLAFRLDHLFHPFTLPKNLVRKVSTEERVKAVAFSGFFTLITLGFYSPFLFATAFRKLKKMKTSFSPDPTGPHHSYSEPRGDSDSPVGPHRVKYSLEKNINKILSLREKCDRKGKTMTLFIGWDPDEAISVLAKDTYPVSLSLSSHPKSRENDRPHISLDTLFFYYRVDSGEMTKIRGLFETIVFSPKILFRFPPACYTPAEKKDIWTKMTIFLKNRENATLIAPLYSECLESHFPQTPVCEFGSIHLKERPFIFPLNDGDFGEIFFDDIYYLRSQFRTVTLLDRPPLFNPPAKWNDRPWYVLEGPKEKPVPELIHSMHSAWYYAAWNDDAEGIEELRKNSNQANCQNNKCGYSPLHIAARYGSVNAIKALVKTNGVNVNLPSESGLTPLHIAVNHNFIECVDELVKGGADPDIQITVGADGHKITLPSPREAAQRLKHAEILSKMPEKNV